MTSGTNFPCFSLQMFSSNIQFLEICWPSLSPCIFHSNFIFLANLEKCHKFMINNGAIFYAFHSNIFLLAWFSEIYLTTLWSYIVYLSITNFFSKFPPQKIRIKPVTSFFMLPLQTFPFNIGFPELYWTTLWSNIFL